MSKAVLSPRDVELSLPWRGLKSYKSVPDCVGGSGVGLNLLGSRFAGPRHFNMKLLKGKPEFDSKKRTHAGKDAAVHLRFERLLADLSALFVNVQSKKLDEEIEGAQRRVCECLGLDVSALWQLADGTSGAYRLTHYHRTPNGAPVPERMDAHQYFPWCSQELMRGRVVKITSIAKLPPEAVQDRASWTHFGIKSSLVIPLSIGGGPVVGFLSFDSMRRKRAWPKPIIQRLELVGQVFANALARQRFERNLRENEERLNLATDSAGVGLWSMDLSSREIWTNSRMQNLFRFAPSENVTYQRFLEAIQAEDREAVREAVQCAVDNDSLLRVEFRVVLPDGNIRWISARGHRHCDEVGTPDRLTGVSLDISERIIAERVLEESRVQALAVMNSTDDLIWSVDPEQFGLLTWNDALRTYFFKCHNIALRVGLTPRQLLPPAYAVLWPEFYRRALAEGSFSTEYTVSSRTSVLLLSFHVLKRGNSIFGISVFGKDITGRKAAEHEAAQHRAELAHLTRVMTLSELSGSLAHELNQPLAAILTNAQAALRFLKADNLDMNEIAEILRDIVDQDRRAGAIIGGLRAMMKKGELQIEARDLNADIREVLGLIHSDLVARNITTSLQLSEDLPQVRADRVQMEQVLLNLVMNACDAMSGNPPDTRTLHIVTEQQADNLVLASVVDCGIGIRAELMDKIFKPFQSTKPDGLGMGLSICQSILAAHGGSIWASNNPGGGATFHFTLQAATS